MNILTISDSPHLFSGLGRVHRHVIDAMVETGHSVVPCVWFGYDNFVLQSIMMGSTPPELYYESTRGPVRMLAVPKKNNRNEVRAIFDIIATSKPDVVITIGDYWDSYYMQAVKQRCDYGFKWLAYLTIESDEIDKKLLPLFRYMDAIAVPTAYGKAVLESAGLQATLIPYGLDGVFRRLPEGDRLQLREERGCSGKTRFITVAQNTLRKNLPVLMQAVKLICHRDPKREMQFYVHTNIDALDPQEASIYDLRSIASQLGVEEWFSFPEEASLFSAPNDEALIAEYNASDFFVTPSIFEGFGLPICEAMACGLPVIAQNASSMPEHVGQPLSETSNIGLTSRGWLVGSRTEVLPPDKLTKFPRPDALAQAIWEMHLWSKDGQRNEALEKTRKECQAYAQELTWEKTKKALSGIVAEMGGECSVPVEVIG